MKRFLDNLHRRLSPVRWAREEGGVAAVEAALLFPVMLTMLLGMVDIGNAILSNQKTITASQVTADLIARKEVVSTTDINEAIEAARLALEPFSTATFGVDIVSVRFDNNGAPQIVWRETQNMTPNDNAVASTAAIGEPGEGMVIVSVVFRYDPIFSGFVIHEIPMEEVAFVRGRKSPVVNRS